MFLAQLAIAMVVWGATIAVLFQRRALLLSRTESVSRGWRVVLALGCLGGSISLLGLGMGALAMGGLTATGFTWWGWATIAVVGAGFVVLQTVGLVPLVLNAATPVTPGRADSSERESVDRP